MHSELLDNDLGNSKYKLAGYLAIVSAVLIIPVTVITIMHDIPATYNPALLPFIIVFTVIQTSCGLYAFYRFRDFLNEYYDFYDIDKFVWPIILLQIVINSLSLVSRIIPDLKLIATVMLILAALVVAILFIIFCIVLLRLQVSLHGLLKPFAYLTIAAMICFMIFFLMPIGVILAAVIDFILGIILLKTPEKLEVEFV